MYKLARSLHGCQETRSWQERLPMTWQDVPSIKISIAPKTRNSTKSLDSARIIKIYQELARILKNVGKCSSLQFIDQQMSSFFQYIETLEWMLVRYVHR